MTKKTLLAVKALSEWKPPEGIGKFFVALDPMSKSITVHLYACCLSKMCEIDLGRATDMMLIGLDQAAALLLIRVARKHAEEAGAVGPQLARAGEDFQEAIDRILRTQG